MKPVFGYIIITILAVSCTSPNRPDGKNDRITSEIHLNDTVIGKSDLLGKIAGSAYLQRATGYYVVAGKDTSEFMPVFTLSKEKNHVGIDLNLGNLNKVKSKGKMSGSSWNTSKTYLMWLKELEKILVYASAEYDLDSLTGIKCGRMVLTGDLAVDVTRQYHEKFSENREITTADYQEIAQFLMETRLAADFNALLEPWSLKVEKIGIEKAFFTTRDDLLKNSVPEIPVEEIPVTVFDCIVWMIIEYRK